MARYLVAGLTLVWSLAPLRGATLERLSLDQMIQKSTAIVRGRVGGPYASVRGNFIYTHYPVQVSETLKGTNQPSVEVLVPGGTVGGIRQVYSGVPSLVEGKEYVLFLWTGSSGTTQVIGFTQGVFDLAKGSAGQTMAAQRTTREAMVDPSSGQIVRNDGGIVLRLSDLRARIASSGAGASK